VTLQLAAVILVAVPVIAITQPFLRGAPGLAVIALMVVVLGISFWRSAANLQGHLRAGAQLIIEALARQAPATTEESDALVHVRELLPGIGEPVPVRLESSSPAVGRTLSDLHLRGVTGATVLAIYRPATGAVLPSAAEVLQAGDVLALAGTREAVAAARALVTGRASRAEHTPGQLAP
jgi:CPA2 family monovalent cation:H+ antiporter-2